MYGAATKKSAGIESFGLSTVQITEKYKDQTYQKNRYRINFERDGNTYFSSLDFFEFHLREFEIRATQFPSKQSTIPTVKSADHCIFS